MSVVPEHFQLHLTPTAAADAVVQTGSVRFTVLTDRMIRLEYHADGVVEDHASQAFWYRQQPVPPFQSRINGDQIDIETEYLHLSYQGGGAFSPENLSITLKASGNVWHPGDLPVENLLGTTRTLDDKNGYTPLSLGLMSRSGWSVIDNSATLVLNDEGWLQNRTTSGIDWYFFGYGHDYKTCLRDYCRVSGEVPLIPRWVLGNWWSRYWEYTEETYKQLIGDFHKYELPFSVCIIDMDWHVTQTGNTSSGWTGYSWNRKLFPDPEGLIRFMHQNGLKTSLNLHPAEGIHPHEDSYTAMAERLGLDPTTKAPIPFKITDPAFTNAYFEILHHPAEAMGVDFWWMDWQQGLSCDLPGLDPLWWINHLHFYDLGRTGVRRPLIFSRWGNEGHQRYPIGFSGDSYRTWDSLRFQPYMTATAANVSYGWWSHDIGGHTSGTGDPELFVRWVQFGVFSPVLRIHTTKGEYYDQRPWMFDDAEVLRVLREALQLRHALIPYLYTMAYRAHAESLPLSEPMYYEYSDEEAAYHCPQQYLFGTELIAAPFVDPADPSIDLSRQVVWLPKGDWYDLFSGEHYAGDSWQAIYGRLGDIPVFAKAGAIVPMGPKVGWGGVGVPDELHLHVFAGADNTFTLYEDDGESTAYREDHAVTTTMTQTWRGDALDFTIDAAQGDRDLIPAARAITLHLHGVSSSATPSVSIDGSSAKVESSYDAATETLIVSGIQLSNTAALKLSVTAAGDLLSHRDRKREKVLTMLRFFRLNAGIRNRIADGIDAVVADPTELAPDVLAMTDAQARALFEILCEAGVYAVTDTDKPVRAIIWNNHDDERITYRYRDVYLRFGFQRGAHHDGGVAPKFACFIPPKEVWRSGSYKENVHSPQWEAQIDYFNLLSVVEGKKEQTP